MGARRYTGDGPSLDDFLGDAFGIGRDWGAQSDRSAGERLFGPPPAAPKGGQNALGGTPMSPLQQTMLGRGNVAARGPKGAPATPPPGMTPEELLAYIMAQGQGSGSGSGSGGRGAAIAAMLADVDAREQKARDRYAANTADVTTMYGQLASAIQGYRPTIEQDYGSMVANTNSRAVEGQGAISSELATQDARRQAAAGSLGISGEQLLGGPELQSNVVLNEAIGDIGETAANWTGFLEAEKGNSLNRNTNQADAATGTGAQTNDTLLMALEGYLQNLDSERSQIKAQGSSGGGGGGGGGGSKPNPLMQYMGKALIDQMFQGPSEFEQRLSALAQFGVTPAMLGNAQYQSGLGERGQMTEADINALGFASIFDL